MDDTWRQYLNQPPPRATTTHAKLVARAEELATDLYGDKSVVAAALPLDVVVAGSAFHVFYFLGVQTVLSALQRRGALSLHRYAGASSGAQTPFQMLLTGEASTIEVHLAYAVLMEEHGSSWSPKAMYQARLSCVPATNP